MTFYMTLNKSNSRYRIQIRGISKPSIRIRIKLIRIRNSEANLMFEMEFFSVLWLKDHLLAIFRKIKEINVLVKGASER